MKTINLKNFKALVFTIAACYFSVSALAQNQVATPSPLPQAAPQKEMAKPAPTNSTMAMPGNNQGPSKEDMEQRKKMSELNKQIQEAEKAGNGATPEITAKKEELTNKSLEEKLLDSLPMELINMSPEQKFAFENLKKRKEVCT